MPEQREFTWKMVKCPNGHQIKLEMLADTPIKSTRIQCPTCQSGMIVFVGDIRGIVPME